MDIDQVEKVRRAQDGDEEAFIHLVKSLELQMYNVAKSIVKKDEDCADAMQETVTVKPCIRSRDHKVYIPELEFTVPHR